MVLLRDRLRARIAEMGTAPDHQRLAAEVLGIRNAPPELARRLVAQALVVEDRREVWQRSGERICRDAPATPGVYVLRDAAEQVLYVGKANNLRRRLRTHFAPRRWRAIKPQLASVADAEWREVGSELEALLREAEWIHELAPAVNVQVGAPNLDARLLPAAVVNDVIVLLPSIESDSVELVCARAGGDTLIQRTRRSGDDLAVHATRVLRFFKSPLRRLGGALPLAPIVFSWLAGRGANATRLDPHDAGSPAQLRRRLRSLFADAQLFTERLVVR
jgi:predicted GIY-YIG superfamily endonuclease